MTKEIKKLREALIAIEALGEGTSDAAYRIADDAIKSHNHRTAYIFC